MLKEIGKVNALYPMPMTIVGANVNEKANFLAVAHVGIFSYDIVSIGLNKKHYTNNGIRENKTFSINIPSEDMVVATDYVGIVSGKKVDKSDVFEITYGKLKTAPIIVQAPISMECELINIHDYEIHDVFVGQIVNTFVHDEVLNNDKIDLSKIKPMLFDMPLKKYWKLGEAFADCWKIGKEYGK